MRIVCLSDTHGHHRTLSVPDGDLLVHAGDLTNTGSPDELADVLGWFARLPHRHKVFIAGNHDWLFEVEPAAAVRLVPPGIHYLQDSGCVIEGLKVWGSPVQPTFLDYAFNRRRGADIDRHWAKIPAGTDVLVTHGPPHGKRDLVGGTEHAGCEMLRRRVLEVQPGLHVFGHLHEGHGVDLLGSTLLVNAAICNDYGRPVNAPIAVNITISPT
ncbi:MAG TPA: metallophosphatase domain-containing protein [Lacunisphaera sp.]|nr:metallophosphatase domain-containing protein [Lacunisphaera sp.]